MYFKRLEIHGFKSFADPVVIDFKEGITAIVGPNGSGKSNISDAIRWVLGEQSPKELRGGKMEEVIFNGTETRRPRGMAEVTLVIDNSSGFLKVDYNEVAVTRRMFRNGDSEYLINGNSCRLKDIRVLFMDTGIGVDGYSIIGQGKIQDIVSNKSESRREIFEESAGVNIYLTRKAEAERKLEKTNQNLERVNDLVSELSDRVESLQKESTKAKSYLAVKDRYQYLSVNIILKNIDMGQDYLAKIKNDAANLAGQINFTENNRTHATTELAECEAKMLTLDRLMKTTQDKIPEIVEELSRVEKEKEFNRERLQTLEVEIKRINEELQESERKVAEYYDQVQKHQERKTELSALSRTAVNDLEVKEQHFKQLSKGSGSLDRIVSEGNDRLFELHSLVASKKSEAKSVLSYKQTMERRKREIYGDSEEIRRASEKYTAQLKQAEARKKRAEEEKARIETEIVEVMKRMRDLEETRKQLRNKVSDSRIAIERKQTRLNTINEMEHNYEGYNNAVRYVMQANLTGVEGVCADMIDAPEGLELAVETALGAGKQNIIIRDDASAKKAVTALKLNRKGRLTFLPVESITAKVLPVEAELQNDPGFIGLAVDVVKFRERYRKIFQYLLGRVAIVEDLDTAIRLSKKTRNGLRFVTRDGEVVNASGAITGGQYRQQTSGIIERRNEKARLSSEIEQLQLTKEKETRNLQDAERSLEMLQSSMEGLQKELSDSRIAQNAVIPEMESCRKYMEEAGGKIRKNTLEVEKIEKDVQKMDAQVTELMNESKTAEADIARISREINEAMNAFQEKQDQIREAEKQVNEGRIAVNEWNVRIENLERLLDTTRKMWEEEKSRVEAGSDRLRGLEKEKSRLSVGTDDTDSNVNRLAQEKLSLVEKVNGIEKEKVEVNQRRSVLNEEIRRYDEELHSFKTQRNQAEIQKGKTETNMENLKDKLWDEFEISFAQAMDQKEEGFTLKPAEAEVRDLKSKLRALGDVSLSSIKEFEEVNTRYQFLSAQKQDVETAKNELEEIIRDLDRRITKRFRENFELIRRTFEITFTELFGGGHAELVLSDEKDIFHSGIDIVAQPPGKKLQNINLLSGGEKTMTAIALMFSVLKVRPTPFCILDEVEAALDDANISRFADYLKNFRQTQFALITHQKATMAHADALYGITMPEEGISKVLSLKLSDPETAQFASTME